MNPVEVPLPHWRYTTRGIDGQGGFTIALPFPVGSVAGLSTPAASPGLAPPDSLQAVPAPPSVLTLPDTLKAYVSDKTQFSFFTALRGTVGMVDLLILPQPDTKRTYLLIVNPDPANTLYVQFGGVATIANAFPIPPNFGSLLFDARVPQDDIHIIGSAVGTQYSMLYSNRAEF